MLEQFGKMANDAVSSGLKNHLDAMEKSCAKLLKDKNIKTRVKDRVQDLSVHNQAM